MAKYAAGTNVNADQSRAEIQRTLERYGADQFMFGWDRDCAVVGFRINDRQIRFVVPMPDLDSDDVRLTDTGKTRTPSACKDRYDQLVRQRWRALLLVIKGKLEAVESGIVTFDAEFLAHIVLPDGRTVADTVVPRVEQAYRDHEMPSLLPEYAGRKAITA